MIIEQYSNKEYKNTRNNTNILQIKTLKEALFKSIQMWLKCDCNANLLKILQLH